MLPAPKKWNALWLQDPRFDSLSPINVFRKVKDRPQWLPEIESAHPPALRNVHFMVRKVVRLERTPAAATIAITADDHYKLYVNGVFVGEGPAPAFPWCYWFDVWDVAPHLRAGRNVIAIHTLYQGLWNFRWVSADLRMGVVAELAITDCCGGSVSVSTDASWRAHIATAWPAADKMKNVGIRVQPLEHIDGRLLPKGWREDGFDDSSWFTPSCVDPAAKDYVFRRAIAPVPTAHRVAPATLRELAAGRWLMDFGREVTGSFGMRVSGAAGGPIEVRHAEELNDDGSARFNMRCGCNYSETWTLAGRDTETLEQYDYKGFRYVEVVNSPTRPDASNAWVDVRHYPFPPDAATFKSSSDVLNRIWDLCVNGVRCCAQDNYVDCPTREKGQYAGDNTIAGHAHVLLTGDNRLARKSILDLAATSRICPGLITTGPCSRMHEIADYSLQFPLQVERDYWWTGDRTFVREMLPVADGLIAHFRQFENSDGLLESVNDKWNLVDWPVGMRDGYDFDIVNEMERPLPPVPHNVLNAWYIGAIASVSRLRVAAGFSPLDTSRHRSAFARVFRSPATGLFVDRPGSQHSSLHSNALPLYFGLVEEADKAAVFAFLRKKRMSCGVYMAYFLLNALYGAGERDFAYDLMSCADPNSWQSMLASGATACMEAWSRDMKTNGSMCHAWSAAPIQIIIERIMGVRASAPGWGGVSCEPVLPQGLDWAELSMSTPAGRLTVSAERRDGRTGKRVQWTKP